MPELRRLENEDINQLYRIHAIVFNQRRDFSSESYQIANPLAHPAEWAWGIFEGTKLIAGMYELDYLMRFDGHSVKMTGVSGVGTLPEARKGGHVRRIFEKALPEEYEKGVVFSTLTPFSHDFYRKFGYEIACARTHISISTGDLYDIQAKGEFVHILPGDDTSQLAEVHSAYISNINQGIHRDYWPDNRAWKNFTNEDPYKTGVYLYLWKDETGKARSYIKYKDVEEDEHNMSVTELAFVDRKGLYGALSIVGGLSAQFESLKWDMPTFIDPFDFMGDGWSVETETRPRDMIRVVNVKTALELMRRPRCTCSCEGEYVIEVEDENLSANNGKYLVQFGTEGSKVSSTSREPDMYCDIQTLSQLIIGYRSLENAIYSRQEGLEVYDNEETLKSVFTLRPQHITEYF